MWESKTHLRMFSQIFACFCALLIQQWLKEQTSILAFSSFYEFIFMTQTISRVTRQE